MAEFMLFLHETPGGGNQASPEEIQAVIQEYKDWSQQMAATGKLVGGDKLTNDAGRHLTGAGDDLSVTDGPYAEAKELMGGYFRIAADDYDEAVAISRSCPHLKYGGRIEVRQVHEIG